MCKILRLAAAALVVVSAFFGSALADDPDQTSLAIMGSTVRTDASSVLGCVKYDDWKRLLDFAYQKDQEAFLKFATGHCTMIPPNIQAYVEDSAVMTKSVCIRPRGQTECVWVPRSRVIK
jgi:hypothetical protein